MSNKAKVKLNCTIIRPVMPYDSETWVVNGCVKQKVLITEIKMLSRILDLQRKETAHGELKQVMN